MNKFEERIKNEEVSVNDKCSTCGHIRWEHIYKNELGKCMYANGECDCKEFTQNKQGAKK